MVENKNQHDIPYTQCSHNPVKADAKLLSTYSERGLECFYVYTCSDTCKNKENYSFLLFWSVNLHRQMDFFHSGILLSIQQKIS